MRKRLVIILALLLVLSMLVFCCRGGQPASDLVPVTHEDVATAPEVPAGTNKPEVSTPRHQRTSVVPAAPKEQRVPIASKPSPAFGFLKGQLFLDGVWANRDLVVIQQKYTLDGVPHSGNRVTLPTDENGEFIRKLIPGVYEIYAKPNPTAGYLPTLPGKYKVRKDETTQIKAFVSASELRILVLDQAKNPIQGACLILWVCVPTKPPATEFLWQGLPLTDSSGTTSIPLEHQMIGQFYHLAVLPKRDFQRGSQGDRAIIDAFGGRKLASKQIQKLKIDLSRIQLGLGMDSFVMTLPARAGY